MINASFSRLLLGAACLGFAAAAPAAGDAKAGQYKFSTCAGCHAIPGYTNVYPTYHVPKLGGQYPDYIVAALKGYQSGQRHHPTMGANAASLSEADMADIAAYVAAVEPAAGTPTPRGNPEAGKQKAAQVCAACHGADGHSPAPAFPRIAGQHADYLVKALEDYSSGARNNPIMAGIAKSLSAQDRLDLAAWFAAQPKGLSVVK
ncbi:cytochrome c553 [Plasticicumulans lactativorans]|uniref:Cytochrome c553 n=1 Tax=Plasticicumulans lactativorans TaxID=1133106 RepID=A0A4V2SDK0_9GAMM|nr:c-type cytochrome [Plasticicumulans lactativorans]TCO83795.1 cytochrome c553 [Plasticicumulans lactativorans]